MFIDYYSSLIVLGKARTWFCGFVIYVLLGLLLICLLRFVCGSGLLSGCSF